MHLVNRTTKSINSIVDRLIERFYFTSASCAAKSSRLNSRSKPTQQKSDGFRTTFVLRFADVKRIFSFSTPLVSGVFFSNIGVIHSNTCLAKVNPIVGSCLNGQSFTSTRPSPPPLNRSQSIDFFLIRSEVFNMGNQLSGTVPQQIHPVEFYLSELSSSELLTFDCNMGSTRFFKVARIKLHQSRTQLTNSFQQPRLNSHLELNTTSSKLSSNHGQLEPELPALGVAKVFVINDPTLPLRTHKEKIEKIAHRLRSLPNCLTYKKLIVNDRVAVLLRQYIKYNLYDRLSTRPFLSVFEKKWISFQLLRCLQTLHANGITHGDIKLENVLITSSGWVLLTDFASYKPTFLPEVSQLTIILQVEALFLTFFHLFRTTQQTFHTFLTRADEGYATLLPNDLPVKISLMNQWNNSPR